MTHFPPSTTLLICFPFKRKKQEKTIKWKKDITGKWTIINQSLINYTQLGDSMRNLLQKNQKSSFPRKLGQRLALFELDVECKGQCVGYFHCFHFRKIG